MVQRIPKRYVQCPLSYWQEKVGTNHETLTDTLQTELEKLFCEYSKRRETGEKDPLAHIFISILWTSVPDQHPLYRIDLCGVHGQADIHPVYGYWDISPVGEELYQNLPVESPVKTDSLKEYEVEELWFLEAEKIHQAMSGQISEIIAGLDERLRLKPIFFGEYMTKQNLVK